MKNFLSQLFGRRPPTAPVPAPARKPVAPPVDLTALRQRIDQASPAEREPLWSELGIQLGRAGTEPLASDAKLVWVQAISRTTDKRLATAWLGRIDAEADLEQIASAARLAEIRLLAAQRLTDSDRLARLARLSREKDRGVYRHCQGVLRQHREKQRQASAIARLQVQLRDLISTRPIAAGPLYELRKGLADLDVTPSPELEALRELMQQATRLEQEDAAIERELNHLLAEARDCLQAAKTGNAAGAHRLPELAQRLVEHRATLPAFMAGSRGADELDRLGDATRTWLESRARDQEHEETCRHFLATLGDKPVGPEQIAVWQQLAKPEQTAIRAELEAEWEARRMGRAARPQRAKAKARRPQADLEAVRERLDQLDQSLDAGETQQALAQARELEHSLREASLPRELTHRYQALQGRLNQLRDWARWSGAQAREKLIAEAEALASGEASLDQIAEVVPKLREEWKRVQRTSRTEPEEWDRFNGALNRAYQPVLAARAERDAQQNAVGEAKAKLLQEAEQWLADLQPDTLNAAEVQRQRQTLRQHWRRLPPAAPRDERRLQSRFHQLMVALDTLIEPHVQAETERRNRLMTAAARLRDETDLHRAIEQARLLNHHWKDDAIPVLLPRDADRKQWQRFREAIDAVFARRDSERQSQQAHFDEWMTARRTQLETLETLLSTTPTRQSDIESALTAFQTAWDGLRETAMTRRRDELDHQADALLHRGAHLLKELALQRQGAMLDQVARKAGWCEELEAAVLAGNDSAAAKARLQALWEAEQALPGELESLLAERFSRAATVTVAEREMGQQALASQVIDLEILLDLPTPPESTQERQARQLEWLQAGVKPSAEPADLLRRLVACHAASVSLNADQRSRLEQISSRMLHRLAG